MATDYGDFLAAEPTPLQTSVIKEKLQEKLVREFQHVRDAAVEPLATFLDYITYEYMIDNIVLLINGTLHERDIGELLEKAHPLGMFDVIGGVSGSWNSISDLYNAPSVLISEDRDGEWIHGDQSLTLVAKTARIYNERAED